MMRIFLNILALHSFHSSQATGSNSEQISWIGGLVVLPITRHQWEMPWNCSHPTTLKKATFSQLPHRCPNLGAVVAM
jgi:hypothetical protein